MALPDSLTEQSPAFEGDAPVVHERKRGRPKADTNASINEAQLLQTAFAMFAAQGYEASTMRAMARELGVSHNLLNVRFGRKSELWKAAVDWRLAEASRDVEMAFASAASSEDQLRDLVHRFCRWSIANSDIVAMSYSEGQQQSWRLDHLTAQFILPFQKRLQRLLGDVASRRDLTPLGSGALMAILVHGVSSYFALGPLQAKLLPDTYGAAGLLTDQEARADAMAQFLLAGLLVDRKT